MDYRAALRERTGVGEYVHELARALVTPVPGQHPDTVVLFTSSWKDRPSPDLATQLPGAEIADRRLPVRVLTWAWNRLEWPPVEWLSGPCAVVHSQSPLLIPSSGAAQVVTIHDLDFLRHPENVDAEMRRDYPVLARHHAARADAVVVSSDYAAGEVTRELGLPRDRVHVCSPGTPDWAPAIAAQQLVHRGHRILFVGTLGLRKNVGTLLEAYARLVNQDGDVPPLTIAGRRTPDAARWEARAQDPPLRGRVEFTGYVDAARRLELYADARMLVLPSYEEGFGLPVLEAMACGIPVVISSRGSLPEVAGDAAEPVHPDDAEGFTSRMRALLDDETAARAAERGLAQARRYSWAQCATSARATYRAAIEAHAHRG